jgi:hypothetical protein
MHWIKIKVPLCVTVFNKQMESINIFYTFIKIITLGGAFNLYTAIKCNCQRVIYERYTMETCVNIYCETLDISGDHQSKRFEMESNNSIQSNCLFLHSNSTHTGTSYSGRTVRRIETEGNIAEV